MDEGADDRGPYPVIVHCFRCDHVVEAVFPTAHQPLWCEECQDFVLAHADGANGGELGPVGAADERDREPSMLRRQTFGAAMLGSAMLGLQQAIFGPIDDQPTIVMIQGEPERDDDIEVHLEERPADSWVWVKRR